MTTIYYMSTKTRTSSNIIGYGLYLYFLGLSFRNTSKALSFLKIAKISHISIWKWIQKYKPWKYQRKRKIEEYIIDETSIKSGSSNLIWLWVVIEPTNNEILSFYISKKKRNMFVAERFLSQVVNKYGLHSVSSDGGTWYPQAFRFLNLYYHIHFIFREKPDRKNNAIYKR